MTVNFKSCGFNSSLNLNICHQVTVNLSFKGVYHRLSCAGCKHLCLAEVKLCNSFKEVELFVSCHQLEVRPVNEKSATSQSVHVTRALCRMKSHTGFRSDIEISEYKINLLLIY